MPSYRYEASDALGKIVRGTLDAESERSARNQLRSRGLFPISTARAAQGGALQARLSDADLAWLTRQLASLLAASLPLDAALTITLEQAEKRHIATTLTGVRDDVRAGHKLSSALASRPRDFPEIYRALIGAGEESGDLSQVMEKLANYIEERNALRSKVLTAFIYPVVVGAVSVLIVIFLLGYVVPQVVSAFSHAKQQLPLLTRIMLALSDYVREWGLISGLGLTALIALWRYSLRMPAARAAWHGQLMRLPLAGRFVLGVNAARFASTLAILCGSGVPILAALDAARRTMTNDVLRTAVQEAAEHVGKGASLSGALARRKVFPPILIHLVASGEKTGQLPELLDQCARNLSRDLERRALAMTALLEPALILVMGGLVLLIVLAVMMPILEMNQLIR
ncbi:type II secretion system inner membrane protein GspF [Bordetella avium]|uniref:type II secretion system inner membrane protein GspF n=1 Tax=Bordetella avium TaxID=521 RepID=UPI000E6A5BE3|nr:type II secretion system inner membrane protein GspF [Bordetella avium]AZY47993.1 type II secretion system protein GspF [Bordetella avium]RIQ72070.1 type II secretion system protein GspF [Bordetella avium]